MLNGGRIRCRFINSIETDGATIATLSPVAGQTAPKRYAQSYSVCFTARGRVPRRAQPCVKTPFCPYLISSWSQTSMIWPGCSRRSDSKKGARPS